MVFTPPSPAERMVFMGYAGVAVCGAILGSEALSGLQGHIDLMGEDIAQGMLAVASAVGGCIAAGLLRDKFGFSGRAGALRALLGVVFATATLGIAAGTFVLPVFGTMFGPWLLVVTLVTKPLVALPWLLSLLGFHLAFRSYRREQNTVFRHLKRIDDI